MSQGFQQLLLQRLTEINAAVETVRSEQAELKTAVATLQSEDKSSKEEKIRHAKMWGAIGGVVSSLLTLLVSSIVDYFAKHK